MSLSLTPPTLEATYDLLRTMPPFKRWKLPVSAEVEFHVKILKGAVAEYAYPECFRDEPKHVIRICTRGNRTLLHLIESMAHEMVHLHQRTTIDRGVMRRSAPHGAKFKRLAAQVCRQLGFTLETF